MRSLDLLTSEAWSRVAPMLSVSGSLDLGAVPRRRPGERRRGKQVERMRREGVFTAPSLLDRARASRMRRGIEAVRARLGHEVFALVFDEFWIALAELSGLLEPVIGEGFRVVPMPYVNHVPPGAAGFSAHRDRYDSPVTDDGLPNMVTAWISLTAADAERACLSVLPSCYDPCFPNQLARQAIRDIRDVRALPVPAGSLICFNQAVLHWGTRNVSRSARVSFAFELERKGLADARDPAIALDRPVSFAERLGFVGAVVGMLSRNNVRFTESDLALASRLTEAVHGARYRRYFSGSIPSALSHL